MSVCCVNICHNTFRNNKNTKFYRFPMYNSRDSGTRKRLFWHQRMEWIKMLRNVSSVTIEKITSKRVCSAHFKSGIKADPDDILNPDWIPWQNLTEIEQENIFHDPAIDRSIDSEFNVNGTPSEGLEFDESIISTETLNIREISQEISKNMDKLSNIREELLTEHEISHLKTIIDGLFSVIEKLQRTLTTFKIDLEYFKDNDKKTLYYTGLPKYTLLEILIAKLSPFVDSKAGHVLPSSQMIILTLMKLRLGLHCTDLGYRFNVSNQTASRAFYSCVHVMYCKMKGMVYRPPKNEVMNTMPNCFKKNFGDQVAHIIDCVELFIEAPYHFDTRIQCWSEYKHHYTLKYLVSITPQGLFEFISKGYGGRANDMLVTTTCNFPDILEPNDLVLADKGFNMHDVFKLRGVELEIPTFVCKKQQLHPLSVEATRKIANVRIHVERCMHSSIKTKVPSPASDYTSNNVI